MKDTDVHVLALIFLWIITGLMLIGTFYAIDHLGEARAESTYTIGSTLTSIAFSVGLVICALVFSGVF